MRNKQSAELPVLSFLTLALPPHESAHLPFLKVHHRWGLGTDTADSTAQYLILHTSKMYERYEKGMT